MRRETKLFIIPNEDILEESEICFERTLKRQEKHLLYMREFAKKYHLEEQLSLEDSNIAPIEIAHLGHLLIKTNCDFLPIMQIYIPEEVTSRQREWFLEYRNELSSYSVILCHSYLDNGKKFFDNVHAVYKEIEEKYQVYVNRRDDNNVRKKI